jgi:hypothetical protein
VNRRLGLQEVKDPRISRQTVHEGAKVVSSTHWPPLTPGGYSWYSFLLDAESTPGRVAAGRIMSMKNSKDRPAYSLVPQLPPSQRILRLLSSPKIITVFAKPRLLSLS